MSDKTQNVVVTAFTEDQVERLTGVSVNQLRNWDVNKFFVPSLAYSDRRQPFARLYSFRDLVCLKVLNALRNDARVSMQHLKKVKDKLAHLGDDVWAKTTLYVLNRKVVFDNPETKAKEEIITGQGVLQIPLQVVTGNMQHAVAKMRERDESSIGKVETQNAGRGRPVIAGTRVPVTSIKAFAAAGYSVEEILREYPSLTAEDIRAAINFGEAA